MEKTIQVIGKIIKGTEKASIHFLMAIFIKGNLKKICLMEKGL